MRAKVVFTWRSYSEEDRGQRTVLIEVDDYKSAASWANLAIATGLMNKPGPISYEITMYQEVKEVEDE